MRESKPEFKNLKPGAETKIAIIVANWNLKYNEEMFESAKEALISVGLTEDQIKRFTVPGAYEIPVMALKLAESGRYSAVICFATVIKGGTIHFELVANDSSKGMMDVSIKTGVPILNGILACNTAEQAEERASRKKEDKGSEIALSALQIISSLNQV